MDIIRLLLGLLLLTGTAVAATQAEIGDWVLNCPEAKAEACTLRSGKRLLESAGITADLEIALQDRLLVPVVILRGLPRELLTAASLAGKPLVTIQFFGSSREDLDCSAEAASYVCSPRDAAARHLAERLPLARSVSVRVAAPWTADKPLPTQARTLELSGTAAALTRYRAAGPSPVQAATNSSPSSPGVLDMALKAAGYPGIADLQGMLAKFRDIK